MQLPEDLRQALEREAERFEPARISQAIAELSERYRAPQTHTRPFIQTDAHRVAYASVRLPATLSATASALLELKARLAEMRVHSLLDLGAGPGTVMWAAASVFEELERVTLVERDEGLIALGQRLAGGARHAALAQARWLRGDLRDVSEYEPHDVVVISYALGELEEAERSNLVQSAWRAARQALVIVEPGTPKGYRQMLAARNELIACGAKVAAPCPHASECPLAGDDWCHFSERVERTSQHRRAKAATLSFEDEKFSYIAVARETVERAVARIIRHPLKRMGHLHLDLCAREGLKRLTISKKNREAYRRARKVEWGAAWDE